MRFPGMTRKEPRTEEIVEFVNAMSALTKVALWRCLGDALLEAGNDFDVLIRDVPRLEKAVRKSRIEMLTKEEYL